jgi:hypothetical protein
MLKPAKLNGCAAALDSDVGEWRPLPSAPPWSQRNAWSRK